MVFKTTLVTLFQLYRGGQFSLVKETGVPCEDHRSAWSHWQTISQNVVLTTPRKEWGSC